MTTLCWQPACLSLQLWLLTVFSLNADIIQGPNVLSHDYGMMAFAAGPI